MPGNETKGPNKDKSWLHSDIYDRPAVTKSPIPRTSIFKFGSFVDVLTNGGKLIGQILISGFLFVMLLILFADPAMKNNDQYFLAIYEIVGLICTTISVFLAVRIFDGSDIADIGLQLNRRALIDFLFGFTIIFLIIALEFLMLWASGFLKMEHTAWETQSFASVSWNIFVILLIFIFVGWNEELLSRGFHLRIISKGLNRPLGIILSSAIFSYAHRNNSEATLNYFVFIFLFGVIMSFALLRTSQLWLAMGIHAGWDFFVTIFWGTPISDLRLFHLFDIKLAYHPIFYFMLEIFNLAIITTLICLYTSRRKAEILDW